MGIRAEGGRVGPCLWGVPTSGTKADFSKSSGREAPPAPGQPRASSDTPGTLGQGPRRGSAQPAGTGAGLCPSSPVWQEMVAGSPFWGWEGGWQLVGSPAVGELLAPVAGLGEPGGSWTA